MPPDPFARTLESALRVRVERGSLVDLDRVGPDASKQFLFNPTELEETHGPRWARMQSPGLSHEPMQYLGTENVKVPLTLYLDQLVYDARRGQASGPVDVEPANEVEGWRRFLVSLTVPRRTQRLQGASPSPVLFTWPGMFSMRVRVVGLRLRTIQFASGTSRPRILVAEVQLEEDALGRIWAPDVLQQGTIRPWAASNTPRRL